ncbi:long-chain fatty acid--CoA ligase [Steroidobacter sp. S1-65]|uniref:Long-chain fatty acid--CoA ligase n=1 Tax=Steroidobacter gossypii TaxID=2805490 RepID=A0ABS1WWS3_9GAMM|nr:long-chain fatty acid--CoA ligase [Steroidobacter gossypii]MBM0105398.1 long-chain fatty acid--CoA ligase [Steroidobacter gossypii]
MSQKHFDFWPVGLPRNLTAPATNVFYNVEVSASRYPNKPYVIYFEAPLTFARFKDEAERLAGYLQNDLGVQAGDRVLLVMQNSPQFILGYYGILRANAVVVPVNPMSVTAELEHYVEDSGAKVALVTQEVYPQLQPLIGKQLQHVVLAAYSDYINPSTTLRMPDIVSAPRQAIADRNVTLWVNALEAKRTPGPLTMGSEDLCVIPYSSGTTGRPKGCMLTHHNVMHTLITNSYWFSGNADTSQLVVLPFFHVTSMQGGMNAPMYQGGTIVLMCRWDREVAAELIQRYKLMSWTAISTMVIDFLANPRLNEYDLSSLVRVSGGGAAMPAAVGERLQQLVGSPYIEGYGLTETIAPTHVNPPDRPKRQCLGIPIFNTDSRIIDPDTLQEVPQGTVGEIVTHGPQVFQGYWRNPEATEAAFIHLDGKKFFRTGDLGYVDEDGYFFLVDRLKRMINCSGFKVWPAEVEALMYQHPAIQEACVIAAKDAHRGETVKAVVVLRAAHKGKVSEADIIEWTRQNMATYKHPRIVEFVESLPKSATGKVQWRLLQEAELARSAAPVSN